MTEISNYGYGSNPAINEPTKTTTSASGSSGAMAFVYLAQAIGGAINTYEQQQAQNAIERVRRRIIMARAQEAEARVRQHGNNVVGAQRAAMAAQGLRLNFGSAQDVQEEAKTVSELDALTIKNNALREAFGYSVSSDYAASLSTAKSADTLLTGGIQAYNAYKYGGG